ncbi:hypothetical protein HOLleu_36964 [Holothuria leucospilota]|uniref:B box-type domain-containing protein n=1 Tax=Holothuria leucospilota TaxID=206669 RepID=A0A9Q1BGF3_HOLLE|nr:hypothetical protein HOLleu_36964 [Holothuria leucospilota]
MNSTREYQSICHKLVETLLKDEMIAIMVQLKIDRATRKSVTDGSKFIDVLEMREVIGVGNFHRLIPLLKDLGLDELASLLHNHMTEYKAAAELERKSGSFVPTHINVKAKATNVPSSEKKFPSVETSTFCKEHKTSQELICMDCHEHVCFACAYLYHKDHQVLSLEEVGTKIEVESKAVEFCIGDTKRKLKGLEDVIALLEEEYRSVSEKELQSILEGTADVITVLRDTFKEYVNDKVKLSVTLLDSTKMVLTGVEQEIFLSEEEIGAKLYPEVFTKLYELNKREIKFNSIEKNIDKINQQLKDGSLEISVRPTSISANIARVSHGCILGAVMATAEKMVVIRSQITSSTRLNVACMSCFDPKIFTWEYTFECETKPYPLVLGNKLHITPRKIEILLGCGNEVTIIQLCRAKDVLCFVEKTSTMVKIQKGSHITAISTITGNNLDMGVILSDKNSGVIQIFDNKFQLTKKIKHSGELSMITCVFRNNVYKYAVAARTFQSVDLLRATPDDEIARKYSKLQLPDSNLHAQSLLFDGAFFTVLWVSGTEINDKGQKWKVVAYKDDGEECNVSKEGRCAPNIKAVSISHVKNDTLLCFSNGTFDLFQTIKI